MLGSTDDYVTKVVISKWIVVGGASYKRNVEDRKILTNSRRKLQVMNLGTELSSDLTWSKKVRTEFLQTRKL